LETVARPFPGPVQVLIAGQVNVGKSSLVNALLQDSQVAVDLLPMTTGSERYQLTNEGEPIAVLIDTPGITSGHSSAWWHRQCAEVDCLVWVVAAHRADRELDLRALETLRENFRGQPQRSMPPVLVVVSHIDRLSPAREWSPPYNLIARTQPKAAAIGAALDHIAQELHLQEVEMVPVRLDQREHGYNIDLLWALLKEYLDNAKQGRAQRLQLVARKTDWKKLMQQARGAGRLIKSTWQR
ncbi:MAG: GTPase domain-containing protein, partial [Natronospirillum sp.]